MLRQDQEGFLRMPNIVVLSTVGPDGRPHAAPYWYLYEDGLFRIHVGRASRTRRNIDYQPWVALVVDRRTPPYYAVMIRGLAEITPPMSPETRRRVAVRYLGDEQGSRYIAQQPIVDAVTIRVRPEKVSEHASVNLD